MALSIKKHNSIKKTNPFFRDLINIMNNSEFKQFYNKYFNDWSDIQAMIFFMKLYSTIDYEFTRQFNAKIENAEMEMILDKVMENSNTRKMALSLFNDYKNCIDYKNTEKFRTLLSFSKSNQSSILDLPPVPPSSNVLLAPSTDSKIETIASDTISDVVSSAISCVASDEKSH